MIEHPRPRNGFPSIFFLPEVDELKTFPKVTLTVFDQCRFGQFAVKGTGLLSNMEGIPRRFQGCCCNHPKGAHTSLEGTDSEGRFLTSYAQEYPPAMCEALSASFLEAIRLRPPAAAAKVKVPAITEEWTRRSDWHLLFRSEWGRQEHQNVLELRTIVNLARHLGRTKLSWGRRFLVLTDSMVSLGALGKGRSSSPALLRLLRRWAALRMALGISLSLRWVPSRRNLANGPSRGAAIGEHPDDPVQPRAAERQAPLQYRGQG